MTLVPPLINYRFTVNSIRFHFHLNAFVFTCVVCALLSTCTYLYTRANMCLYFSVIIQERNMILSPILNQKINILCILDSFVNIKKALWPTLTFCGWPDGASSCVLTLRGEDCWLRPTRFSATTVNTYIVAGRRPSIRTRLWSPSTVTSRGAPNKPSGGGKDCWL